MGERGLALSLPSIRGRVCLSRRRRQKAERPPEEAAPRHRWRRDRRRRLSPLFADRVSGDLGRFRCFLEPFRPLMMIPNPFNPLTSTLGGTSS